jgi:4'-phosphopantetheinyl transferase EntD
MGISKRRIKGAEFLAGRLVAYAALLLKLSLITKNVI